MYKDKEKEREAARERMKRYRQKGVTKGVTSEGVTGQGVTYPDIIDKLTDSFWRPKLEGVCNAFQHSHHPSYMKDVWLGNCNLSNACEWLECTS